MVICHAAVLQYWLTNPERFVFMEINICIPYKVILSLPFLFFSLSLLFWGKKVTRVSPTDKPSRELVTQCAQKHESCAYRNLPTCLIDMHGAEVGYKPYLPPSAPTGAETITEPVPRD